MARRTARRDPARERTETLSHRTPGVAALLRLVPHRFAGSLGAALSWGSDPVGRRERRLGWSVLSAERFSAVELCRRVSYEGFEHVHGAAAQGGRVVLLVPSSGRRLLLRVLELFRPAGQEAVTIPVDTIPVASAEDGIAAARQALAAGSAAVWALARPAPKGSFLVRFLPPVVPEDGETQEALAGRYQAAWEGAEDDG